MKLIFAVVGLVVLIALTEAGPAVGNGQKPGTCYRPRYRRSASAVDEMFEDPNADADDILDEELHSIQKRQVIVRPQGGYQGGNLRPTPAPGPGFGGGPGFGYRPRCYRDYDCTGNKKCCSGVCQTPAFIG